MLIRIANPSTPASSEITPEGLYRSRRRFLADMGLGAAALLGPSAASAGSDAPSPDQYPALKAVRRSEQAGGEAITPFQITSTYNNYYEFGTGKDEPSQNAGTLKTRPWSVMVEGECEAPKRVDIEDILKFTLEERVYRHRCVEAWSIVVPWLGFPLGNWLQLFKPTSKAKYVAFETLKDAEQMPLGRRAGFDLPYIEGLRIDEAMHPLSFVSVGMYGHVLPNQNGAPLRLTIPWKYGYKSIKSIVRVRFTERKPDTTWNLLAPEEYGFFSNVNPEVSHPRWSQSSERRLGELFKRPTLPFNGYPEVASLYAGMKPRALF